MSNYGTIIISYGRSERLKTFEWMNKKGWAGDIVILIDDKDRQGNWYRKNYGDIVEVFSKEEMREKVDIGDNFESNNAAILARMATRELAKSKRWDYFFVFDDDVTDLTISWCDENEVHRKAKSIKNVNAWAELLLKYIEVLGFEALGFDTVGTLFGGAGAKTAHYFWRYRFAQAYLQKTEAEINMRGRSQEDLTTSAMLMMECRKVASLGAARIITCAVESIKGGMTEEYKGMGDIVKNIYPVMYVPSVFRMILLRNAEKGYRTHIKRFVKYSDPKIIRKDD